MKDKILPLLEELKAKIAASEARIAADIAAVNQDKVGANVLCRMAEMPELYEIQTGAAPKSGERPALKFRSDQFVNKSLSDAVTEYLEARKSFNPDEGPATIDQIHDGLISGGFKFGGTTDSPANQKRAMNIALTRNTAQMHKINENTFGLRRWYGMRASRKMATALTSGGAAGRLSKPASDEPAATASFDLVDEADTSPADSAGVKQP